MISNTIMTVTTAATDRRLLTIEEMRAAVGIADASSDAELSALGLRIADSMAMACRIRRGGVVPPTFRVETLSERFESTDRAGQLMLSRRPVVAVTSVLEVATDPVLDAALYYLDPAAGMVFRLDESGRRSWWWYGWSNYGDPITVVYSAGWAEVPEDLKLAAEKYLRSEWSTSGPKGSDRDPNLKRLDIPGVAEREWWVDPKTDTGVPAEVMDILDMGGYVQHWRA